MTLEELAKKVQVMEDIEAIKQLKYRYAKANDHRNHVQHLEYLNEVFVENGVWDGKEFGVFKGRKQIIAAITELAASFSFSHHFFTNPDITIDGDKAHAHWCVWAPHTMTCEGGDKGLLLSGYVDDDFVRIDGRWWQTRMELDVGFLADYDEGWHKNMIADYVRG